MPSSAFAAKRFSSLQGGLHAPGAGAVQRVHHRGDGLLLRQDLRDEPQGDRGTARVSRQVSRPPPSAQDASYAQVLDPIIRLAHMLPL